MLYKLLCLTKYFFADYRCETNQTESNYMSIYLSNCRAMVSPNVHHDWILPCRIATDVCVVVFFVLLFFVSFFCYGHIIPFVI